MEYFVHCCAAVDEISTDRKSAIASYVCGMSVDAFIHTHWAEMRV